MIILRLKHDHETIREQVYRDLPVTVGRSNEADFVLTDDSVSMHHASIVLNDDDELVIKDLSSRNGIRVAGQKVAHAPIEDKLHCFVGVCELEIERLPDHETREVHASEWDSINRRRSYQHHILYLLSAVAGYLAFVVLQTEFWAPWEKEKSTALMWHSIGALATTSMGAGLVLVALRTLGRRVRFADPLGRIAALLWLMPAATLLSYIAYYLLPTSFYMVSIKVVHATCLGVAIYGIASLRRETPMSNRLFASWVFIAILIIVGQSTLKSVDSKQKGMAKGDPVVLPPLGSITGPSHALDRFYSRIDKKSEKAAKAASAQRLETP